MNKYHKIQTVFKRDPETKHKTLLEGQWSIPEFGYLAKNRWMFTEKIDGTNIRVMLQDGKLLFRGKTDSAQVPAQLLDRLNERFGPQIQKMLGLFPDGVCLYGEGYGAKIQKAGKNYRPDQGFALFDIKIGDYWLQQADVSEIASQLNLPKVPVIGFGTLSKAIEMTRDGFCSCFGAFQAEGIVARPTVELQTRKGERIITKIKHRDFAP